MPSEATRWQRRNRRYLGVSFAVSHFIHLGAILALASVDRALFWKLTNITTIVLAGTAYLFIAAMAATSFDRTAAWLGPRKWRLLHLLGGWYIWISFAIAVGKRVPLEQLLLAAGRPRAGRGHRAADRHVPARTPDRRSLSASLKTDVVRDLHTDHFEIVHFNPPRKAGTLAGKARWNRRRSQGRGKARAWRIFRSS